MHRIRITVVVIVAVTVTALKADNRRDFALQDQSLAEVLQLHAETRDELRRRGVVRTGNNLTGDLAEHLFVSSLGWQIAKKSQKGFDATDRGVRYQIKARRGPVEQEVFQLGAIRDLDGFDFLAVVIFDPNYQIREAVIVPVGLVRRAARFNAYTNSYRFMYRIGSDGSTGLRDVTQELRKAAAGG